MYGQTCGNKQLLKMGRDVSDQPRDKDGKWTESGGKGSKGAGKTEKTTEELEQADRDHAKVSKPSPITLKDGTVAIDHDKYPKWLKERTFAELQYIASDAAEAAKAQKDGPKVGYYLDEVNYALDEMYQRERE